MLGAGISCSMASQELPLSDAPQDVSVASSSEMPARRAAPTNLARLERKSGAPILNSDRIGSNDPE